MHIKTSPFLTLLHYLKALSALWASFAKKVRAAYSGKTKAQISKYSRDMVLSNVAHVQEKKQHTPPKTGALTNQRYCIGYKCAKQTWNLQSGTILKPKGVTVTVYNISHAELERMALLRKIEYTYKSLSG